MECALRLQNGICGALFMDVAKLEAASFSPKQMPVTQSHRFSPRRRTIYRANESSNSVAIICDGWACAYTQLRNGERQIVSFLLPGDITSSFAIFQDRSELAIEAVTDLRYCVVDKDELKLAMLVNKRVFDRFSEIWVRRKSELERLATDLGHRTAEERIARLIITLFERCREFDLVHEGGFAFPLRLRHIADAMGLTVVHVSRVINTLRRLDLIEIEGRFLTILDLRGLQNAAN